jgi:hypothetical protein
MRRLIAALFVLAASGLARAADEPKPNTLTPKEIADGWILLFDGETTFGWKTEGEVGAKDGLLTVGSDKAARALLTTEFGPDFDMHFEYKAQGKPGKVVFAGKGSSSNAGVAATGEWFAYTARARHSGRARTLETAHVPVGGKLTEHAKTTDGNVEPRALAISLEVPAGGKVWLRNVKLLPLGTQPLFNGKDLTGWKKYTADGKRDKTEFSVTGEGFLHLKNGPGDLQSEQQFDDFVAQVECRTNGKNLNSGVFFRCIPGDYQNGYEAQVHNGFADAPKEYVVEEYDPKTHELKDKAKVKSAAIDYGTGAIYRRVPARTHASHDNEWFTMTVVAHGRHIATWVNGVQQVDWTDNRPLKDNPRNGCRLEKGPISLQGHDPTTDIDFRSIRAVTLPKAAGD